MSEVSVVRDAAAAPLAVAELFLEATAGAVAARGRAVIALTGGSTAPALYAALRADPWRSKIPWSALEVFTGDERAVPPEDSLSNYGVAARELFAHVPLAEKQLHRMRGEAPDLAAEAERISAELEAASTRPARLDLLLLGLGPDGHILSLFAGVEGSGLRGDRQLVRTVAAPEHVEPRVARITFAPYLVVTARTVVLQVMGKAKAAVLTRALRGPEDLVACPAQWVRRASGRVVVVCDDAAASEL